MWMRCPLERIRVFPFLVNAQCAHALCWSSPSCGRGVWIVLVVVHQDGTLGLPTIGGDLPATPTGGALQVVHASAAVPLRWAGFDSREAAALPADTQQPAVAGNIKRRRPLGQPNNGLAAGVPRKPHRAKRPGWWAGLAETQPTAWILPAAGLRG